MSKIAIVYWSGTGNTEAMAISVAEGVSSAGAQADVFTSAEFTGEMVNNYTGIALGCPSMGDEVLEETEFEPMFNDVKSHLSGKAVALFGSYGWGDGEWMRNWEKDCTALGIPMAAAPVIANEDPDEEATEACKKLGAALVKA